MPMFQELFQLAVGATLTMTISADEKKGQMTINVIPKPHNDAGEKALSTPLVLTATPDEFEAEFVAVLTNYRASHMSLAQQAQATQEVLDAAKAASVNKATGAVAKAQAKKPAAPAPVKRSVASTAQAADEELDTDDDDGGGAERAEGEATAVPAAGAGQDTEPSLFG